MNRYVLRRLVAVSALVAASVVLAVGSPAAAAEPAPKVVPALQSWAGGTGRIVLHRTGRVVIPAGSPAGVRRIASQLVTEAAELTPLRMTVLTGTPAPGDIALRLDAGAAYGSVSAALKPEAYRMVVGSGRVELVGAGEKGLYYATRTLLQTLLGAPDRISAPAGTAVDWPDYAVRGFMLDVGRRYFTPQYINSYIRWMGWLKMNTFQLHLNDNEINAPGGDWGQAYSAFRLRSANPAFAGLAATDGSYSRADWDGFENTALAHAVTIVPEIDAPAHSRAFIRFRPSMGLNGGNSDHLDLSKPESTDFMRSVYDEFVPWFRGPTVHVGLDEYPKAYVADYQRYHNAIAAHVRGLGKDVGVWGSYRYMSGTSAGYDKNVAVNVWNHGWYSSSQAVNEGYRIINTLDSQLYVVPTAGYYNGQGLDGRNIFLNWAPHTFGSAAENLTPQHPNLLGAMHAVWNDLVRAPYTELDVHRLTERAFNSLAQKMWSQGDAGTDYAAFLDRVFTVGQGPGTGYLPDTLAPDVDDLARGMPATASSSETAALGPAAAVDGDPGSRWASQYRDDQWLRVDLGSARMFTKVRVAWEAAYARDYDIEISGDGGTWTSVAQRRGLTAPATDLLDVGDRTARYVRMRGITRGTAFGYSVYSFEVLAGGTGPVLGLGGKCLDVSGGTGANGTQAILHTCTGGENQRFTTTAGDALRVLGKCLDVNGGSTADGARVQIWDCNGGGAQRWVPRADGALVNPQSGRCLDVTGNNPADGTPVTIWTCGGGANQRWTLP
ncbi:lectin [Actinoplanes sp. DH11]|uniref:lectin n=1 Tax=Actinoplanes sp. DH11 TaxID=2857011 RepID=UPI001E507BA2|nr:lectin [Actinoplanes sp. DH11]